MDFLFDVTFLEKPLWMWLGFLVIVGALLIFDLGVLHRKTREIGVRESLVLSAVYIALGVGFGGGIALTSRARVHLFPGSPTVSFGSYAVSCHGVLTTRE